MSVMKYHQLTKSSRSGSLYRSSVRMSQDRNGWSPSRQCIITIDIGFEVGIHIISPVGHPYKVRIPPVSISYSNECYISHRQARSTTLSTLVRLSISERSQHRDNQSIVQWGSSDQPSSSFLHLAGTAFTNSFKQVTVHREEILMFQWILIHKCSWTYQYIRVETLSASDC